MSAKDFAAVCSKIDEISNFLNEISQDIWRNPELGLEEVYAHEKLTTALEQCGFSVQRNYILSTAFRAEYSSLSTGGPVVAILLEYDALPGIGHACGHNLIAEAGLAAGIAIKSIMDDDSTLVGKLLLLGTPAEENGGGKIKLLNAKAFDGIDAALMVHPVNVTSAFPPILSSLALSVDFKGKESHAAAFPWEGCNALDAAVICYQSLALQRQQMKPSCRIHAIITNGGKKINVIPAEASMEIQLRAPSRGEVRKLLDKILTCIKNSAESAACTSTVHENQETAYESLITNKAMAELFEEYAERLGLPSLDRTLRSSIATGSTDMGNVSRVLPSIHPFFKLDARTFNHTTEFARVAGSPEAQEPTLKAAKAMALTALKLMRCPEALAEAKKQFQIDLLQDMQ